MRTFLHSTLLATLLVFAVVLLAGSMSTTQIFADTGTNNTALIKNGDVLYLGKTLTAKNSATRSASTTKSATSSAGLSMTRYTIFPNVQIEIPQGFAKDIGSIINALLSLVMLFGALLVFLQLILGGLFWITAGGDKGKTEAARQRILSALLGLIVLSASFAVFSLALNFIGFASIEEVFQNTRTITGE